MSKDSCITIAHRGFSGIAPENTLNAFRKAMEEGVQGIELDVHQTKDNKVVVIHDPTIDRTTDGRGRIGELTYDEIQKMDAGTWFSKSFAGEKVPLLEEVLQLLKGKATLYIEIKKGVDFYPGIEKNVLDLVNYHKAREWCVCHSFEKETLQRIYAIDKTIPLLQTMFVPPLIASLYFEKIFFRSQIAQFKNLQGININHTALNASLVHKIQKRKLGIITWTVNTPKEIQRMKLLGVDGIISNFPDRVKNQE